MHAWEAVQQTLYYIEEHNAEDIPIEKLSEIAALSVFYYQRLFTKLVKKPVREYIKLRRLAFVCDELRGRKRIIDIAIEYGFGSHEVFTRAFKEAYGVTPTQYREGTFELGHFTMPNLLLNYAVVDEGVPLISDGMVLEMNRITPDAPIDFYGIQEFVPFTQGKYHGEQTGVNHAARIWQSFYERWDTIPRVPGGRTVGIHYHGDAPDDCSTYFVGAEVASAPENLGFTLWRIPVREYVVCGFEADSYERLVGEAMSGAMKYTRLWLRQHDIIADGFFPEMHYGNLSENPYMELWVPYRQRLPHEIHKKRK